MEEILKDILEKIEDNNVFLKNIYKRLQTLDNDKEDKSCNFSKVNTFDEFIDNGLNNRYGTLINELKK